MGLVSNAPGTSCLRYNCGAVVPQTARPGCPRSGAFSLGGFGILVSELLLDPPIDQRFIPGH